MQGDLLAESSGTRVLASAGPSPNVEVSFQGNGKLLGQDMTDFGTYQQTLRPGGVFYGEGQVLPDRQSIRSGPP